VTGRTRMRHKMREVRRHARADAHECCGARALRASGVGWRTEEAKEHKRDRDPGRGARAGRANMLRSVGARSALAFNAAYADRFRNRKFGARGRSSAPCGSPPCSSPTASRPCARRAEQRFKRERACVSLLPGQDAMPVCVCVCVCGEAPLWVGWRKSAVCAREGGRHAPCVMVVLAGLHRGQQHRLGATCTGGSQSGSCESRQAVSVGMCVLGGDQGQER